MTRQEILDAIVKNADICPYQPTDAMSRVELKRPMPTGLIRWLEEIAPGAAEVVKHDNAVTERSVETYYEIKKQKRDI